MRRQFGIVKNIFTFSLQFEHYYCMRSITCDQLFSKWFHCVSVSFADGATIE